MQSKKYEITCLKCKGSSKLTIVNGKDVIWQDQVPIISARLRPDMNWGFECGNCGNDSRISIEEKDQLEHLVKGSDEMTIKRLAERLKKGNEKQFRMAVI